MVVNLDNPIILSGIEGIHKCERSDDILFNVCNKELKATDAVGRGVKCL